MEMLRVVVAAAFALLALLTARLWWQKRSRPTAWLAGSFGALALGLVSGRVVGLLPETVQFVLDRASRVVLLAFPYLLFRFTASLDPPRRGIRAVAATLAGALVTSSALVPSPPPDSRPAWYLVFVVGALLAWTFLSAWVVWRLWRSGERQAAVARRRMRTLAVAAAVLNLALIVAGATSTAGTPPVVVATIQSIALLSAVLFYLGFAPPGFVRAAWRSKDERALWRAESGLVAARTRDEVVRGLLPHISHLLGGGPVLFVDRFGEERTYGDPSARQRERLASTHPLLEGAQVGEDAVVLNLQAGRLGVASSPFTPLFGTEEIELTQWLGSLMDLALDRVELHERERRARAMAEQLTRELESLVYGITHDLRNPIVSILGYLDCLAEDHGDRLDEEGWHYLTRLRTNASYMDRLIADLLALSRIGRVSEDAETVDLTAVAEEVGEQLRESWPEATITIDRLPSVLINPARARQLLTNLLTNALVHGGRADIKVRVESVEAERNGLGCFAVIDNGRGIPEAYRGKVFGLFERLDHGDKSGDEGTGIGLAMCQRIAIQAGGSIWVAGSSGGADVRVQLPLAVEVPRTESGR